MRNVTKKKLKKIKQREKDVRQKKVDRQLAQQKTEAYLIRRVKLAEGLSEFDPDVTDNLLYMDDETVSKLESNLEKLRSLKAEYQEEVKQREKNNLDLESLGHVELQDKLNAAFQNNLKQEKRKLFSNVIKSDSVIAKPEPQKKAPVRNEVSEVEVIRAKPE